MAYIQSTTLMDKDTGEIVSERRRKYTSAVTEDGFLLINKKCTSHYWKASLPEELDAKSINLFFSLIRSNLYNDNILSVKKGRKWVPMTTEEMYGFIPDKVSRSTISRRVKPLFDTRMIIKIEDEDGKPLLIVNPIYALYGKRVSMNLFRHFKEDLRPYMADYSFGRMEIKIRREDEGDVEYKLNFDEVDIGNSSEKANAED